jgi:hypothetical protein
VIVAMASMGERVRSKRLFPAVPKVIETAGYVSRHAGRGHDESHYRGREAQSTVHVHPKRTARCGATMKRSSQAIGFIGLFVYLSGAFWLGNFALNAWWIAACLLLITVGLAGVAIGAGLLRRASSREPTRKSVG